ncbi:uncharacterized protein CANTADRAFT_44293 [Suhomyces tanzawaensis NRRL Y-17324]|uniref:DAGKc domain-containing protein n=1 Tax=Suhomyces tanzawaensis NRRL Y-17324 TaxID=984487 RepID=A0A1E4SQ94_9ASCO|nr:uncharacterized protein CANTADRAFT_44293 [Suhomyces tanzawaensis NRRL Y-17324]ODV81676.1 hypothetical protein CANTADRAFT_44293 [Suhomyces tanzawaensis NRRL Y-17324]
MVLPPTVSDLLIVKDTHQKLQVRHGYDYIELVSHEISEQSALNDTTPAVARASIPDYLKDKVYVVDSVKSGKGRDSKTDLYNIVLEPILTALAVDHQYVATTSADSIRQFASTLPEGQNATVVFISGDTSISEFVNGLSGVSSGNITIFPIPSGTGNSLALSLGFVDELRAIQRLLQAVEKPAPLNLYDVQFPEGSYFLIQDAIGPQITQPLKFTVVVSWGFHAALVADSDTPELRKNGIERFKLAAFANLQREQKYEGLVSVNGHRIEGPFAYWVLTSSKKFEPTFEILPEGNIFDDNLYLISFKTEESSSYIMDIMKQVYDKGSHVHNPKVSYQKISNGDRVLLHTLNSKNKQQRRFCVDGSIVALPETDEHEIAIRATGNKHNGWSLYVVH